MNSAIASNQESFKLSASISFWILNAFAWCFFALVHAAIESMRDRLFLMHLQEIFGTSFVAFFFCYGLHLFSAARRWYLKNPLELIPILCVIAAGFSLIDLLVHFSPQIAKLSTSCAFNAAPPEFYQCGIVSNAFFERFSAMLIWGILYASIQFERSATQSHITQRKILFAIIALVVIKLIEVICATIAWTRNFQLDTILYTSVHGLFPIIVARFVLLLRPRQFFLSSRLIPLLPTFFILIFFLGILEIIFGNIFFRIINYVLTGYHSDEPRIALYFLLGGADGIWHSAGDLSGPLYASCRDICIIALYLWCARITILEKSPTEIKKLPFDLKRSFQFWIYNINGWFIAAIFLYFSDALNIALVAPVMPITLAISFLGTGALMSSLTRSLLHKQNFESLTIIPLTTRILLTSGLLGLMQTCAIWYCNYIYIYLNLTAEIPFRYAYLATHTYHILYLYLFCSAAFFVWSFLYESSVYQREKVDAQLKNLHLENNIKQLQLDVLASKLDPHFIFNALNNIRYLVKVDVERAREALLVLSDILRNPIAKNTLDKILLTDEMALVRNYLLIAKLQFEERLTYQETIDKHAEKALIPPMMLQILIENAIKHGISHLPDGGELKLFIALTSNQLICRIENSGNLLEESTAAGFGIGTQNIKHRLHIIYGELASFSLFQREDKVIAELKLPLEF